MPVSEAQKFLGWLHQHDIAPAELGQAHIDAWNAAHRVHERQYVRGFLTWAITSARFPPHLTAPRVAFPAGPALTQQRRLALLRRYLTAGQEPVPAWAAACLLLLFAQPLSRIHRLTTADLTDTGDQMHLRLGDPPSPVPEPVAALLRELPRVPGSPWLFPGLMPGQPAGYTTMLPLREARISALRQLVLQAPSSPKRSVSATPPPARPPGPAPPGAGTPARRQNRASPISLATRDRARLGAIIAKWR